jgi:hypothetical protein
MLVIEDEVTHIDGLPIPVGIAPASQRVRRIREQLGNAQRLVELTVSRKNAWGACRPMLG